MSIEMSAKYCVSEGLCSDEHSFTVKKTATKARIEEGIIHSPYPDCQVPSVSLYALLAGRMQRNSDKTAILCQEKAVSHGELLRRFRCITAGLQSMGLGRGDRVYARFSSATVDGLAALCGVMFSGATLILAGESSEDEHLASIKSLDVTHLLIDSSNADIFISLLPQLTLKGKLSVDDTPGFTRLSPFQWEANEAAFDDDRGSEDDVMMIAYSSGTSGLPKNIELQRRYLIYYVVATEACEPLPSEEICIIGPSITFAVLMYHLKGLYSGAAFVMMGQQGASDLLDSMLRHKVTWFASPQFRVLSIARQVEKRGCGPPPSLRSVVLFGAPVTVTAAREITATLRPLVFRNAYGTTETGFVAVPPRGECAYDNVGFPVPGTRIKVIDMQSGRVLGPMKEGEVLLHSPAVMKGYYNMPAETELALDAQGWFHTGDVGMYDENGRLYMVDRIKCLLVCFSWKVSSCQLEDCLLKHPDVAEAAVFGVANEEAGDLPAAVVVLRPGHENRGEELAEELMAHVAARHSWYRHHCAGVYVTNAIPTTETGKIRRRDLAQMLPSLQRLDRTISTA
ncbi:uncharacterized protein LOC144123105 [Amblyomma americanum]